MINQTKQYKTANNSKQGLETQVWSDSVLRRRRAVGNSDTDSSSRRSPSPPPDSLLPLPPNHVCNSKNSICCFQNSQNSKKYHKHLSLIPKDKKCGDCQYPSQLEAKLYNTELQDALVSDKLDSLTHRLNRTSALLEATIHYAQCLDMKERAASRLTQLATRFIQKDLNGRENLSHQIKDISCDDKDLQQRLSELKLNAVENMDIPDQLAQLMEEHKEKRKNYTSASNVYSDYLRRGNHCSNSQLRRLDNQYETIHSEYEHSRRLLDQEVPKHVNKKLRCLEHCFMQLMDIQQDAAEKDKQLAALAKDISKEIRTVHLEQTRSRSSHHINCGEKCSHSQSTKSARQ